MNTKKYLVKLFSYLLKIHNIYNCMFYHKQQQHAYLVHLVLCKLILNDPIILCTLIVISYSSTKGGIPVIAFHCIILLRILHISA